MGLAAFAALAGALLDVDGAADEAELLAEPALDEAEVGGLQLAGREQHEGRRLGRGLRPEPGARLLAAADRVRVLGDEPAEERVQCARTDPRGPALEGGVE